MERMDLNKFYIGVDNAGDILKDGVFHNTKAAEALGYQFMVWHDTPRGTLNYEIEKARKITKEFEESNLYLIYNNEISNWVPAVIDADGFDWSNNGDGSHCFRFRQEVLNEYVKSPSFMGVCYDEAEHMQINRSWVFVDYKKIDLPFLSETTGKTFRDAQDSIIEYGGKLTGEYIASGVPEIYTEHVWPVLFHAFARAGFTPVYKQLKESIAPIWASLAMGAARQYNKPLWTCLDLWYCNDYPGHSPGELKANLEYGYLLGVNRMYVENINYNDSLYYETESGVSLTEYGDVYASFAKNYIKNNPRSYTHSDYTPKTAIIRFDDTFCGQNMEKNSMWKPRLLGAYNLQPNIECFEWLDAWYTITHHKTNRKSISWNHPELHRNGMKYYTFVPCVSPIVYDENVTAENLTTLDLVFLCGLYISSRTLSDVANMVKLRGLTVVTTIKYAPAQFAVKYGGGTDVYEDGLGKWVICESMADTEVYDNIKHLLGNSDEMVYHFKNKIIRMKITDSGKQMQVLE